MPNEESFAKLDKLSRSEYQIFELVKLLGDPENPEL